MKETQFLSSTHCRSAHQSSCLCLQSKLHKQIRQPSSQRHTYHVRLPLDLLFVLHTLSHILPYIHSNTPKKIIQVMKCNNHTRSAESMDMYMCWYHGLQICKSDRTTVSQMERNSLLLSCTNPLLPNTVTT